MSRTKQTQPSSQRDGPRCRRTSRWERTRRREEVGKTIIMKEEKKDGVDLTCHFQRARLTGSLSTVIFGANLGGRAVQKRGRETSSPSCGHDLVQGIIYKSVIKRHGHVCHGIL